MVVKFVDLYGGGFLKYHPYETIYIECEERDQALAIFLDLIGTNPEHVTCPHCGPDFAVFSYKHFYAALHEEQEQTNRHGLSLVQELHKRDDVLVIRKEDLDTVGPRFVKSTAWRKREDRE